jgi:uncharacterized repeat protein (TIGR03803 family)
MRVSTSVGYALSAAAALVMVAGSQSVLASTTDTFPGYQLISGRTAVGNRQPIPYTSEGNVRAGYQIVHSFATCAVACEPQAGLTVVNGELYGTSLGGASDIGSIYKLSFSGDTKLLYSFKGVETGEYPQSILLDVNGEMYGTTSGGPSASYGTVFKIDTSGQFKTLYRFKGGTDGSTPVAGLTLLNGMLYGTTESGGASGVGTVFELSSSGRERVLYSFKGSPDASNPTAGLTALNGSLYGTTFEGGSGGAGFGTVFEVSTSGTERVIYSFLPNGTDGENPQGGVIAVNGELYGTTYWGGTSGYGSVFKVSRSGKESVMYSFLNNGTDGNHPFADLTAVNGDLYGTASAGGISSQMCPPGCGSVFKISASGKETVLHLFADSPDGGAPVSALVAANGALYGTTQVGGKPNLGTVFKVVP